ncbi:hypothetical protein PEC301296_08920 [Pectobacterium carotovorum subsp. carotovorum]|nr:hypothetical protein GZ59_32380 [Pectobacterium atrosepticum]POW31616.1 hypothetical protein PB72LOC_01043 [Pectobacterium atrosepticum]GKV84580.1 hypothetical protein PEC301296_08920 [Pectobacterium carotovorum subsp. carotovorum]
MVMTKETPRASAGSSGAQHCTKFKTGKLPSPLFFLCHRFSAAHWLGEKGQHHKCSSVITHKTNHA